jgi:DNA-binding response OmpR family regulator
MSKRPRLLLIDDDPISRELLSYGLGRDFRVSCASNGEDGVAEAIEASPDIIILDMQMPGWDGLRTLKSIREKPSLESIPILVLSGGATKESVIEAKRLGAGDYLLKTHAPNEILLQRLSHLLSRQPAQWLGTSSQPSPFAQSSNSAEPDEPSPDRVLEEMCQNFIDGF